MKKSGTERIHGAAVAQKVAWETAHSDPKRNTSDPEVKGSSPHAAGLPVGLLVGPRQPQTSAPDRRRMATINKFRVNVSCMLTWLIKSYGSDYYYFVD